MTYIGELISIGVAFSWTATALLSEFGSKRLGNLTLNVLRMALALVFSLMLFGVVTGNMLSPGASPEAMGWMLLSGLVGYVIGDFCLFQCYIIIGSRYGQLFMPLAPFSANFYRCIAGIIGFLLLLFFRDGMGPLREAMHDKKGLTVATATTIFGLFVGVGFSLMAVQYTAAGIASTLMAMTPIIILLPSNWLFHEKITWRAVLGAVISVIGVSLFFLG